MELRDGRMAWRRWRRRRRAVRAHVFRVQTLKGEDNKVASEVVSERKRGGDAAEACRCERLEERERQEARCVHEDE